jgi:hypothetical protein
LKKIVGALVIVVLVLGIVLMPTKITKNIRLVKVQYDNKEVASEVTTHFDGYKYSRIFNGSRFEGNIKIGETVIERTQFNLNDINSLIGSINGDDDFTTFGSIFVTKSFEEVTC